MIKAHVQITRNLNLRTKSFDNHLYTYFGNLPVKQNSSNYSTKNYTKIDVILLSLLLTLNKFQTLL